MSNAEYTPSMIFRNFSYYGNIWNLSSSRKLRSRHTFIVHTSIISTIGYIYRKMWIFRPSFFRPAFLSSSMRSQTFLHHFMSGRISCRFGFFFSTVPMFSCRLPNNKCVFFSKQLRGKNVWHKCLLATLYRFFAINFMFRSLSLMQYTKVGNRWMKNLNILPIVAFNGVQYIHIFIVRIETFCWIFFDVVVHV